MRYELEKFFSNPCESSGLLIAEAPTGYGKTYETIQAIYQYLANGGSSQVLFVTNLLKNLPVDELRNLYEKNGRASLFEKEVLVLSSAASSVEKAILTENIPLEFHTDVYQDLFSACQKKKQYQEQLGEAGKEITKHLSDQIREKLEPQFRHELEVHLQKTFPGGPDPRRDAIRNKEKYKWMAKFYPSIFWTEYKVILLSVKKLMARNIPLVEPSFECLSERMLKNKIVCIDEFDASRSVILDSLIDQALDLRADYLQLFLQVYRGATTHQISRELETVRKTYEAGRNLTWEKLLNEAQGIYQEGALYYSMKTVDTAIDKGRNFLFHDTSYHTVLDGNRTHIRAVCNQTEAQVQIHFEEKDEYYAHQDEPRIILQNLLRRIHVFLLRFQRYVYGWAESYAKLVNAGRQQTEDLYTISAAAESIFRQFDLTSEQTRLMSEELTDSKRGRSLQDVISPNLSFYETGFRLFEFIDDDYHRAQTYLQYLQMRNTPENVLLYLCCQAKVVGLSATAALPTVLGNYDLKYIKDQLKEHYHELSDETKASIQSGLETLWKPYKEGRIQVNLQVVDRGKDHLLLSERLEDLFSQKALAQKYAHRLTPLGADGYTQKRYCNILAAMKAFWIHSDIRAFLCLNQVLPMPGKRTMDENLLRDVFEDLRKIYAPQAVGEMVTLRSGEQFEKGKDHLLQDLQAGAKRFVLSSYQTLGAGQNLQYVIQDNSNLITLNAEYDEKDPRFQKKDFDALYLGDVTHTVVNLNETESLSAQELMKFCFQVECLYENDEISYRTLNRLLKDGIGRFSGRRPLNASAQSILRQSSSVHGQVTRDVIQAVGRMGRTFLKNPSVYLLTTEKTLSDLDLSCLNGRILSPEMETLRKARTNLGSKETSIDYVHNEAERKATRGNAYILRMLNVDWTEDTMALWKSLRQTVLQYPRAGLDVLNGNSIIRTYYIPLAQDRHCYFYAQKGDFSEVLLSSDQDKMQFAASLPEGLSPSTVSEEEARLAQILSYPGLKEHFVNHGWATEFGTDPYIMSPVLFQNIYKGALGEVAGKFILEKELGIKLQDIEDPENFESFDFVADGNMFFDFKHWKWNMQVEESPMRAKVLKKMDAVGAKRAFIVNLFSDGVSNSSCSNDGRLIEVPGILLPTGQVDQSALNYIGGVPLVIYTNQMEIAFDFEAITKDFSIFEAKRDQGNYWKSKIPDVALQECRALAVVYEWGPSCYILYHRASVEQHSLKQVLECCEDDVRVQEISAQELAKAKKHLLAQLLCNALPSIQASGELYHNVTGKLYYMQPSWSYYRKEVLASFWTLQISFTKDSCVKLDVKTFSNARLKQDSKNKPQYLFDPECYILRRALRDDPGKSTDLFVIGALNQRRKNVVPFLEFGSLPDYQNCKVGILHQFLRDVRTSLSPYLSLTMVSLDESTHLGLCSSVDSMTGIRDRLRETPLYLEDTVQNEQSRTLISMLRYELAQYSQVTLMDGTPQKGDALLRIIHYPLFYEDHPEDDEYLKAPKHCIVQHITVEDFQLTGMNRFGTKEKEDHKLLKVIQELAIKIDVNRRQMSCYDWAKLGFNKPVTFVMATFDFTDQSKPACYDMLRVQPGGGLCFESWQQSFLEDNSEREKISEAFETPYGKFDTTIKGLVYEDEDNIHIIYDTDRYTLPNMQALQQVLSATRDDEQLPVKPLVETIQKYADSLSGNERAQCQMILDEINQYGMQVTRKELRHILNLRSNLGKRINLFIFEETGILIGNSLRNAQNKEALFGGVLGIRHFCKDDAQYYYSGYLGSSLNRSLPHACRIRKVCSTGQILQFQRYLPLLEVDFVRANGWTVIPFPFKYLREWKAQQE